MQDDIRDLERIASALEAAGDVAYEWDVKSGAIEWLGRPNAALGERFGAIASADDLADRIFSDDATTRAKALARHLSGDGPYDCEYRIRDDHDDPIWVLGVEYQQGIRTREAFDGLAHRVQEILALLEIIVDEVGDHLRVRVGLERIALG